MESSTPLPKPKDLRRLTLIRNTMELSPLRKANTATSPRSSTLETSNNDDLERSRRRSNVEIQKRLSNISQDEMNFNNSYVKEQFVLCTHLFAENKITSKNAWKVQIINMLRPLCRQSDKNILQVIGTSIDISAKVYGLRVDDVYSDGLKLASTLARNAHTGPRDEDEEDDQDDQQERKSKRKKNSRRKVNVNAQKCTVSKAPQSLTGSLAKLEPVDFLSRVKAETGTIDNLFTNVLKEDKIGSTFLLINEMKTQEGDKLVMNDHLQIDLKHLPQLKEASLHINSPFKHFVIDEWDPDQEEHQLSVEKSQLEQVVVDENGFPIPEHDGSIPDIFADNNDSDDDVLDVHEEMAPQLRGALQKIVDFQPSRDTQFSEYSYNTIVNMQTGKCIDQIWAGPSHWKLKFLRNSRSIFSSGIAIPKYSNKNKKKEQPMINYDCDVTIDTSKTVATKKKMAVVDENRITLPMQDQSCVKFFQNLNELMLKPGVFREMPNKNADRLDYEISGYRYENANDSLYCSQKSNQNDDARDEVEGGGGSDHNSIGNDQDLGALLDAPETVPEQYIAYSKKAKQIDMKELKLAVWKILTRSSINKNMKVQETSFSNMFKKLPALLNKKEKEDLSCPLAFVALLHLANENNLELLQIEGYKDFHIKSS